MIVHKPEKVTWTEAAGTIRDGLRAYTALHYLSHLSPGKSVLIMDGASVGANSFVKKQTIMSMYGKNHYNTVISLQLNKLNFFKRPK